MILTYIITGALLALAAVYGLYRLSEFKTKYETEKVRYADNLARLLESERMKERAETELNFLKQNIVVMLQRPVVATMNDEQVNRMTHALVQYVAAASAPDKMN